MSTTTSTIFMWLFVINLGIAFGAGVYEHRVVVSQWVTSSPEAGAHWNPGVARQDDTGRRFWGFVTTVPLTLLTLANLFFAWRAPGPAGSPTVVLTTVCSGWCAPSDHVVATISRSAGSVSSLVRS